MASIMVNKERIIKRHRKVSFYNANISFVSSVVNDCISAKES